MNKQKMLRRYMQENANKGRNIGNTKMFENSNVQHESKYFVVMIGKVIMIVVPWPSRVI